MQLQSVSAIDKAQALLHLQSWIERVRPDIVRLSPTIDLIEERVIDSLQFMNFIAYIEELRGASIRADDIDMIHFSTLTLIVDKFF